MAAASPSAEGLDRRIAPLPPTFRIRIDPSTRVVGDGLLIGGDPRCVVRLRGAALECFRLLASGAVVGEADDGVARGGDPSGPAGAVARRLVDAGLAHPCPAGTAPARADVTVVVPVLNGEGRVGKVRDSLGPIARLVVVDDGSNDQTADTASRLGATVVQHARTLGPAAARNSGLAEVTTPMTMFVDDDTVLEPGWDLALRHFADPVLGAVLPRITSVPRGSELTVAERYQLARAPYDLGPRPGLVAPRTSLGPGGGAAVLCRTDAVREVGGFDPALRVGEDVDLLWSLAAAGWRVQYEPRVTATHGVRRDAGELLRVHLRYGCGDADLTRRHGHRSGGTMSASSLAGAALVAAGRPRLALAALVAQTGAVARRLVGEGIEVELALQLAIAWQIASLRTIAAVGTSTAIPLSVAAASCVPRLRPLVTAALLGRHLDGRRRGGARIDALTWIALRTADDTAHALGTWAGVLRHRDARTLLPSVARPFVDGAAADARHPIPGWTTVAELR